MTPRERAWHYVTGQGRAWNLEPYGLCENDFVAIIEQAIIADRQALQSEMRQKIDEYSSGLPSVKERMLHIVQAVFAQQSQPEESKPERLMISQEEFNRCIKQANENYREAERRYQACHAELSRVQAESDRRVLAEREACAKICDAYEVYCKSAFPVIHKPMEFGIAVSAGLAHNIRARSNQPKEKPMPSQCNYKFAFGGYQCVLWDRHFTKHKTRIHDGTEIEAENLPSLTPFDPECSTCVREADEAADRAAKRVERMISSADRIATLHEWQAKDAQTIEQLNASNQKLSEKVAQLKKEKYELTQIVEYAKDDAHKNHYRGCSCLLCQPSPASRKA